jgi:predicted RNA-binding protein YlqC (UPF0109 family)
VDRVALAFARALVDDPGAVRVHRYTSGDTEVIELDVAPEDRGRLIGRRGQTVSALRTLLDAVAERQGKRCELEILE